MISPSPTPKDARTLQPIRWGERDPVFARGVAESLRRTMGPDWKPVSPSTRRAHQACGWCLLLAVVLLAFGVLSAATKRQPQRATIEAPADVLADER